jgi:carbonic anhydrase
MSISPLMHSLPLLTMTGCLAGLKPEPSDDDRGSSGGRRQRSSVMACGTSTSVPLPEPEWSYHGLDDGVERWGELAGYETCGSGQAQSPINLDSSTAVRGGSQLNFKAYGGDIALDLSDNLHTLQISYERVGSNRSPRFEHAGITYHFVQFHWHSTSEHTIDGESGPLEVHLVHQTADRSGIAVIGVLYELGAEDPVLAKALENAPQPGTRHLCATQVALDDLLSRGQAFYHYDGSLTTPTCREGVQWFVMQQRRTASVEQLEAFQERFDGTTNRPLQPLNGRRVEAFVP